MSEVGRTVECANRCVSICRWLQGKRKRMSTRSESLTASLRLEEDYSLSHAHRNKCKEILLLFLIYSMIEYRCAFLKLWRQAGRLVIHDLFDKSEITAQEVSRN